MDRNETRIEARPAPLGRVRRTLAGWALAGLAALAPACVSGPIEVDASDARALARIATVHVSVTPAAGGTAGSGATNSGSTTPGAAASGSAESGTAASSTAADEALLRAEAESALRAKGYAIGGDADSELILEIAHRTERESVRTWSSDPDASGARQVERTAGVLTLRALDRARGLELWTCDARGLLPEPGRLFEPDTQTVWSRILAQALSRVPDRS